MTDSATSQQLPDVVSTNNVDDVPVAAQPTTDQHDTTNKHSIVKASDPVNSDIHISNPCTELPNEKSGVVPKSVTENENQHKENTQDTDSDKNKEQEKAPVRLQTKEEKQKARYIDRLKQAKIKEIESQNYYMYRDPMDSVLEQSVLLLLNTRGIEINKTALVELTSLTTNFMDKIFTNLHKITEIQRRRQPSKRDIRLMLRERYFDLIGIEDEHVESKKIFKKHSSEISKIDQSALKLITGLVSADHDEEISEESPNYVFFNDLSTIISQIVPPKVLTKSYVPTWLPPFPPEHTYKSTSNFTVKLKSPKVVKEKLVQESRLGEKALYHITTLPESSESNSEQLPSEKQLIESKGEVLKNEYLDIEYTERKEIKWDEVESEPEEEEESEPVINHFEVKDEDDPLLQHLLLNNSENKENDDVIEVKKEKTSEQQKEKEKTEKLKDSGPKFDIVDYSKKRLAILEKKRKYRDALYEKRINSKDAKLGKHLGFYSQNVKHPDDLSQTISGVFQSEYQQVYSSLKIASIKRQKLQQEQEEQRRKAEEERIKNIPVEEYNIDFDMDDNDFDIDMEDVMENDEFEDGNNNGPSNVTEGELSGGGNEPTVSISEKSQFSDKEGEADENNSPEDQVTAPVKQEYVDMEFEEEAAEDNPEDHIEVKAENPSHENADDITVVKEEDVTVSGLQATADANDDDDDDEVDFDFDDIDDME